MIMVKLQYAQTNSATYIFFWVQTFMGNRTNKKESYNSHPTYGLTLTGTVSSQCPTPVYDIFSLNFSLFAKIKFILLKNFFFVDIHAVIMIASEVEF